MATKRNQSRMSAATHEQNIASVAEMFGGSSGAWATRQLKAAVMEGKALSAQALRTLDTLRHEEWKFFDKVLLEEALIRLVGVADLQGLGLVTTVPNALGKMLYNYEKSTFMDEASVSLDGLSGSANDRIEFDLASLPLPLTHKDFFLNLRQLAASREKGEALDTTQVRMAGRVVSEKAEKMLFQGGPTFGSAHIYGYTTFPQRITSVSFDGGKDWGDSTKLGTSYLKDLLAAITALHANRMYGPYAVYVPSDAGVVIDNDYNAATANIQSIRQRLLQVESVKAIRTADQLPSGNLVIVQTTQDVVSWVQGETLQTVQWDEAGGLKLNFKAFQIAVPLIKADAAGRCGVCHIAG